MQRLLWARAVAPRGNTPGARRASSVYLIMVLCSFRFPAVARAQADSPAPADTGAASPALPDSGSPADARAVSPAVPDTVSSLPDAPDTGSSPPQLASSPAAAGGDGPVGEGMAVVAGRDEIILIVQRPPAESASSVHLSAQDLARRPHDNASDLLRQAPGLVVSQHAGGGKADQLFLRGFDADHGTDVALFVDGVPVNLTSHGHGQGYADTHWVIPETIRSISIHKGPYAARFGDFYTAGAVEMTTIDEVPGLVVSLTGGTELYGPRAFADPTSRLVAMASPRFEAGKALLAGEISLADGPFENPQRYRRANVLGKWTGPLASGELVLHTTFYGARWNQSGQIPEREVRAGRLDRFGAIDPTEGGESSRSSVSGSWGVRDQRGGYFKVHAFGVEYRMRLYSNFTLFARDPENGDQIEQTDARGIFGISGSYARAHSWGRASGVLTAGLQVRSDDVGTDLWHTSERLRLAECFDEGKNPCNKVFSRVRNAALYVEEDAFLQRWLHAIAGVRFDLFLWDVEDHDPDTMSSAATTGGTAQQAIASPKLSLVFTPHSTTEIFVNGGSGFHSNDARAAVSSRGQGALARGLGTEVGTRVRPWKPLQTAVAAWYLHLSSEQVWSGDAGGTEPSDPTERMGIDVDVTWNAMPWLTVDANMALARSAFVANRGNGGALALAPRIMGGGGILLHGGDSMIALRARGVGDRPANDDNTLTAEGFLILDVIASHRHGPWRLGLSVNNLLDAEWREAQFGEESRLLGEQEAVEDVHFTPGTPLMVLGTVEYTY